MSIVKSLSVGNGDMFYIKHGSDSFSVIDCCMSEFSRDRIISEIKTQSKDKGILRFISTHPDDDHICGLVDLDNSVGIVNFYCVQNEATKPDPTADFNRYCTLPDHPKKAFYVYRNCSRKWLNESDGERGGAGVHVLWPIATNDDYKSALADAKAGKSPNNLSCVMTYSLQDSAKFLWMGDMETQFMEGICQEVELPRIHILFAPHHGRDLVPVKWLKEMDPKIVVIGEAPTEHLNYYPGYNTLTQNSAGDITFECLDGQVHVYVSKKDYSVTFLKNRGIANTFGKYIGTLTT